LFYDRGEERTCGPTCWPGCSCGRFVEIANILFIHWQYDEIAKCLQPLKTPFDEVVIGVERLDLALQDRESVFESPDVAPLVSLVRQQKRPATQLTARQEIASAHIVADHIRALLFLTADGAPPPGKGGRARIMRTLIRETIANQQMLGILPDESVARLIDTAIALGKRQHLSLHKARPILLTYFEAEAGCFAQTLARGQRQLDRMLLSLRGNTLSGEQTLELVKDFGMPLASVQAIMHRQGVKLNAQEYQQAHDAWRQTLPDTN
jgi:alanyl-tRNA synthetase